MSEIRVEVEVVKEIQDFDSINSISNSTLLDLIERLFNNISLCKRYENTNAKE